jgi:hypothetical protein
MDEALDFSTVPFLAGWGYFQHFTVWYPTIQLTHARPLLMDVCPSRCTSLCTPTMANATPFAPSRARLFCPVPRPFSLMDNLSHLCTDITTLPVVCSTIDRK